MSELVYGPAQYYVDNDILYVDNSILSALATCETKAMMQYGYNLQAHDDVRAPAVAGTAIHKALEVYYRGGTIESVMDALHTAYYDFAKEHEEEGSRLCYNNVAEVVRSWIFSNPIDALPYKVSPDNVELPFILHLTENIWFTGRIDTIASRRDGQGVYLIDTKSTGRNDNKFNMQFYQSTQLSGYVWALEQILRRTVTGIYINVVDCRSVPNSARKCSVHKAPYADCGYMHMKHGLAGPFYRHQQQIETWRKNAIRLAKQWRALLDRNAPDVNLIYRVAQSGLFKYQACVLCGFHTFCRQGRNTDNLEDNFQSVTWWPGDTLELTQSQEIANGQV